MNILFSYATPELGVAVLDDVITDYLEQGFSVRYVGLLLMTSIEHSAFSINSSPASDINVFELAAADTELIYDQYIHAAADQFATAPMPAWATTFPDMSVVSPQPALPQPTLRKVAVRDSQIASGFEWVPGAVFQTRPKDLTLISGRVTKILALSYFGEVHPDFNWLKEDNMPYLFTPDEFMRFAIAVDEFVEQKYINSWQ